MVTPAGDSGEDKKSVTASNRINSKGGQRAESEQWADKMEVNVQTKTMGKENEYFGVNF